MAALIKEMGKSKNDDDNDSLSCNKKARLAWSKNLHAKFVAAVNELGLHEAVPKKIVTLMNVQGITTAHVASHLQKYRLRKKKAADRVPSTLIQPNQSQSDAVPADIYSPSGLNISEVRPSTLVQSQSINNNSFNIHPPPSTFPTHSQNIHPSYNFPANHNSTLLLPNNMPLHQSHTTLPNPEIYSPTAFNISRVTASTLLQSPTQSQNIKDTSSIIHSPPSTFPIYHQHTSTFPTLVNRSTTPLGFATTFDFHDVATFVGSASSKSTSIWDYDWHANYLKRKPQSLQFSHNSLPVLESDKTSQNSQMNSQQAEPFMDRFASSLEDTNIDISDYNLCSENSPIDFSVEETNCNTLEWGCLEEDLIDVWRCLEEENVLNVML